MPVDQLDAVFGALADPTRRAILTRLTSGEASVLELAAPFDVSQPAISRHLKVLERAGLITRGRSAQLRPSRLQGDALKQAADWLAGYRGFWEGSLDRLGDHLLEMQKGPRDD
jgi:DNA-binding transcriptional ArsR family regulator